MNLRKLITVMFIAGSVTMLGFSQIDDDPIQMIARQLNNWISGHPQEKVYLQTDKSYYFNGDQIWFKAYVFLSINFPEIKNLPQ